MDRRTFLRSSLQVATLLGAGLSALSGAALAPRFPERGRSGPAGGQRPDFVEFGSPYRKSCDASSGAGFTGRDPAALREEWIHHRMPDLWRDRFVLGILE